MAKDRNTVAKRQREMERKRKADEKRQHRARRKQHAEGLSGTEQVPEAGQLSERTDPPSTLSSTELSVLEVFRRFRMGPGQMLCFSRADVEALRMPLKDLANNGLLVAEEFDGGYSLTPAGFNAMKDVQ